MRPLEMQSPDGVAANVEQLRTLFPECVTETIDEHGVVHAAIDFDALRQELSGWLVEGPEERYRLEWPGKRQAQLTANAPIARALRPVRDESVDFESTRNVFIEGDNLDALKLIQESYLGAIRCIYIDPPYNTGSDLIYEDDFAEDVESYRQRTNAVDEVGNRLTTNADSSGRYHSDWLSMMFPRLKVARNLLADDGIIFISIDENEIHNLRKLCDEVFGSTSFLGTLVWKRRSGAMDATSNLSADHEYVVAYGGRDATLNGIARTYEKYTNPDDDPRGPWIADNLSAGKPGGDTYYPITDPTTGREFLPPQGRYWPYSRETMQRKIEEGRVLFPKGDGRSPMLKRFASEAMREVLPVSSWIESPGRASTTSTIETPMNRSATTALAQLFGGKVFSFPKPVELVGELLRQGTDKDSIVLDFFAGSGTTAQAVMRLNALDGGNRRFIVVQADEPVGDATQAREAGFSDIAQIARERIRRAGRLVLDGDCDAGWAQDVGFRLLKVDTSNVADTYYSPDATEQATLIDLVDHVRPDRSAEDLLFQVMTDIGLELSLPIRIEQLAGTDVISVDDGAILACLSDPIDADLIEAVARRRPVCAVFRESGFVSDSQKINVHESFRQHSPSTQIRSL